MKTKLFFSILMITVLIAFQGFSQQYSVKPKIVQVNSEGLKVNMFNDAATRNISVYLPPGYDDNSERYYPVIYLLSGEKETNSEWFRTRGDKNLVEILDKKINSGTINPVIVVAVDGRNKLQGCWYTNSQVTGNWEDFVVNDVVAFVDQNFRSLPFAAGRGIAGNSMGGYGALKLATKHPDMFSAVYAMNAFIDFKTVFNDTIIWKANVQTAMDADKFPTTDEFANRLLAMSAAFTPDINTPPCYGQLPFLAPGKTNDAASQWLNQDPMQMISSNTENLKQLKSLVLDCNIINKNIILNNNYSRALTASNIDHKFLQYKENSEEDILQRVQDFMLPLFSEYLSPSLLQVNSHFSYSSTDHLKAWLNTNGKIFIVPAETPDSTEAIETNKVFEVNAAADNLELIPLANLSKGVYKAVGISSSGFIGKPYVFGINDGTPQVKISISDFTTGKPIDFCDVRINDESCTQDADGNYYRIGSGIHNLYIGKEKYFPLETSVTVYTDTIFNFLLVKDSYLQVVEKGYNIPVHEAMVTQNGKATLTGSNGITSVQNLAEGMLDCRIFKQGYFTEVVHIPLQPGQTATVQLTPKWADLRFILINESGKGIPDAAVSVAGKTLRSDQSGTAQLAGIESRIEYNARISSSYYETAEIPFYLQADTIIVVVLKQKLSASESDTQMKLGLITGIQNNLNTELKIYPNPVSETLFIKTERQSEYKVALSDMGGRIVYSANTNEILHRINLSSFIPGIYLITVSSDGYSKTQKIVKQ